MTDSPTFQLEVDRQHAILTFLPGLNRIPWADIESVGAQIVARVQELTDPKVLVDLTPLDYMGSAQVALIVRVFKTVKEKRGTMVVSSQHPVVQEVLTLAGLNKIWTIVNSRQLGLDRLGVKSPRSEPVSSALPARLGVCCAIAGAAALALVLARVNWAPTLPATWAALLLAAGAFGLGLMTVLNGAGSRRTLGVGTLVVGVALLLGSVFALASSQASPAVTNPLLDDAPNTVESADATAPENVRLDAALESPPAAASVPATAAPAEAEAASAVPADES